MITINGVKIEKDEISLKSYLDDNSYNISRIVIEKNGEILPKTDYSQTVLKNGDVVEIVNFVGGG
ncbi:MAG: sulfur carrier protein ThiS [Acutalibacteraceae bacterium]